MSIVLLNKDLAIPLYHQLKCALMEAFEKGQWQSGQQLPNETQLAKNFGVSKITVRKALQELAELGYVRRQQGRGTFVSKVNQVLAIDLGATTAIAVVDGKTALGEDAGLLGAARLAWLAIGDRGPGAGGRGPGAGGRMRPSPAVQIRRISFAHVLREALSPSTGHFERWRRSRRQPQGRENSKRRNLAH
jgi:DNA-binding transcriptional regulator YhcF (GntR family)